MQNIIGILNILSEVFNLLQWTGKQYASFARWYRNL